MGKVWKRHLLRKRAAAAAEPVVEEAPAPVVEEVAPAPVAKKTAPKKKAARKKASA